MRPKQKEFIGQLRKTVLRLEDLVDKALTAYRRENDTYNHLKQETENYSPQLVDHREAWFERSHLESAQDSWLLALIFKDETREALAAATNELNMLVKEAVEQIAAADKDDEEFVKKAKILVALSAGLISKADLKGELLLLQKPRISVDAVLESRFGTADHQVRVIHSRRPSA